MSYLCINKVVTVKWRYSFDSLSSGIATGTRDSPRVGQSTDLGRFGRAVTYFRAPMSASYAEEPYMSHVTRQTAKF